MIDGPQVNFFIIFLRAKAFLQLLNIFLVKVNLQYHECLSDGENGQILDIVQSRRGDFGCRVCYGWGWACCWDYGWAFQGVPLIQVCSDWLYSYYIIVILTQNNDNIFKSQNKMHKPLTLQNPYIKIRPNIRNPLIPTTTTNTNINLGCIMSNKENHKNLINQYQESIVNGLNWNQSCLRDGHGHAQAQKLLNVTHIDTEYLENSRNHNHNHNHNHNQSYGQGKKALITPIHSFANTKKDKDKEKDKQRTLNGHVRHVSEGKSNNRSKVNNFCNNHQNKDAQFRLTIENQTIFYCPKCAVKLASQGFTVERINSQPPLSSRIRSNNPRTLLQPPQCPQHPNYLHIHSFLTQLSSLQSLHTATMQSLQRVDFHYQKQLTYTQNFYNELLCFVEQMRDDHIAELEQQARRDSQIADIEWDYLRENVEEMGTVWADVEANLGDIVDKMAEEDLKANLKFYRHKVQVYGHKIEELEEFFGKLVDIGEQEYHRKLHCVQEHLLAIWKNDCPSQQQPYLPEPQTKLEPSSSQIRLASIQNMIENQSRYSVPKRHSQNLIIKPSQFVFMKQNQEQLRIKTQPAEKEKQKEKERDKKETAFRILFTEDENKMGN